MTEAAPGPVLVIGTGDTKGTELRYVRDRVAAAGAPVVLVDVGTTTRAGVGDVSPEQVAEHHPDGAGAVFGTDRGESVEAMALALEQYLLGRVDEIGAVLGIGGSGGTALITRAMRALPVGLPKIMVSTVASGDVASYVGPADIAMLYSVADVAGLNRITRTVLANAAHAAAGTVLTTAPPVSDDRPAVGISMFGVTTPAATRVAELLGADREPLVFHATGTGGRSMEKLAASGMLEGLVDLTTTEVADLLVGGVFSAGESRLDVLAERSLPWVGSVGAVDMVNFGARASVPEAFADRLFHVHNANVTLMRTTPAENTRIGTWIATKLNAAAGPVRLLVPDGGVSMLDAPGQPFHDPAATAALVDALEATFVTTEDHRLSRVSHHVNDPEFADALVSAYREITGARS